MQLKPSVNALKKLLKLLQNRAVLIFKMYFFRRRYSGAREFNFRWRLPSNGYNRICVSSKDREFLRTVYLRQESSDIFNFEEIL